MLIDDRDGWLCLHNPKAAGSSFDLWLRQRWPANWQRIAGYDDLITASWEGTAISVRRKHTWEIPEAWERYRRFCVVREPLARFASWHRFARRIGFPGAEASLAEFALAKPRTLPPQAPYVAAADLVLRFEDLPDCLRTLPWVTPGDAAAFPRINATVIEPADVWTPEARAAVLAAFAGDYAVCGYELPA